MRHLRYEEAVELGLPRYYNPDGEPDPCPDCGCDSCECPPRCEQCDKEMNPVSKMMGPVCLECVRENHRKATGGI